MLYLLYEIGALLCRVLPIKAVYRTADALGGFYYRMSKRDKAIVKDNLTVVLSQSNKLHRLEEISRRVFVNFARYLAEFFRSVSLSSKEVQKHISIEGKEHLDKALAMGKGVLLISAHLGNWEWGAIYLASLGYKINVVAWTHPDKRINNFFRKRREAKGVKIIPLGAAVKKVLTALKNNELVALLGDIDYPNPNKGIKADFFKRNTFMPKGPAAFSLKTSAPVVPIFIVRTQHNRLKCILEKPLKYQKCGENHQDLSGLTAKTAAVIEAYICRYPEQWFMFHPRWEKR